MKMRRTCLVAGVLFFLLTVFVNNSFAQDDLYEAALRERAEEFLKMLREEKWNVAAVFVNIDRGKAEPETRRRFNLLDNDSSRDANQKIADWFKEKYGETKPGKIISVTVSPEDPTLAEIEYQIGEKDSFTMRYQRGRWYYTFDRELDPTKKKEIDELKALWQRTEIFLQTIRNENWDELYKFVAGLDYRDRQRIKKSIKNWDAPENQKLREKIRERFKNLYGSLKPGKIIRLKIDEKDRDYGHVEYKHEDLDKFDMVRIDGEWYYAIAYLDYLKDER